MRENLTQLEHCRWSYSILQSHIKYNSVHLYGGVKHEGYSNQIDKNAWIELPWKTLKSYSAPEGVWHGTFADGTWRIFHFRSVPVITFMAERKVDNLQ